MQIGEDDFISYIVFLTLGYKFGEGRSDIEAYDGHYLLNVDI